MSEAPGQINESAPLIGLLLNRAEELELMQPAVDLLAAAGCPCETLAASPWTAPERLLRWIDEAEERGIKVIVAAGTEPQLAAFAAAACTLPVIVVPGQEGHPLAAAFGPARAETPVPLAAVRPGGAADAAALALRILAGADPLWQGALARLSQAQAADLEDQQGLIHARLHTISGKPEAAWPTQAAPPRSAEPDHVIQPLDFNRPLGEPAPGAQGPEPPEPAARQSAGDEPSGGQAAPPLPARRLGRRRIDPDAPDVALIEEAVDCLLEGGVIALPTETVYGLAVDATNPAAVERLFTLKERARNKAITIMVDSPRLLASIACNLTVETRRLMEAFWPGPLTIIFQKRPGTFMHVSANDTIGVRLPDHSVPLALMQALARPLACTSANISGQPEANTADQIEADFGGALNLILDAGPLAPAPPSTVIDVTSEPYRVRRLGAIGHSQLTALVGDKLEPQTD